jgi:hypothetical protein
MAMEQKAALFLKVRARNGLAPRTVGIEGSGPQAFRNLAGSKGWAAVSVADLHRGHFGMARYNQQPASPQLIPELQSNRASIFLNA